MPPKKRKGDSSIAGSATPTKKKMTKKEKDAAVERAEGWAAEQNAAARHEPPAESAAEVSGTPSRRAYAKRAAPRITQTPRTSARRQNGSEVGPPPPASNGEKKAHSPKESERAVHPSSAKVDVSSSVPSVTTEPPVSEQTESTRGGVSWLFWLLFALLVLGNVVLGGLLLHTRLDQQLCVWHQREEIALPQPKGADSDDVSDASILNEELERWKALAEQLEAQKRGLQKEFEELLEEVEKQVQSD